MWGKSPPARKLSSLLCTACYVCIGMRYPLIPMRTKQDRLIISDDLPRPPLRNAECFDDPSTTLRHAQDVAQESTQHRQQKAEW